MALTRCISSMIQKMHLRSQYPAAIASIRMMSHEAKESDEQFDNRYLAYFNKTDIDGWEIRKAMNDLQRMDLVPEPSIVIAALKACRRVNDYALAIRYLEALEFKCRPNNIFPYMMQEIQPTLTELGISTPKEMGYDKPEFTAIRVYDM